MFLKNPVTIFQSCDAVWRLGTYPDRFWWASIGVQLATHKFSRGEGQRPWKEIPQREQIRSRQALYIH